MASSIGFPCDYAWLVSFSTRDPRISSTTIPNSRFLHLADWSSSIQFGVRTNRSPASSKNRLECFIASSILYPRFLDVRRGEVLCIPFASREVVTQTGIFGSGFDSFARRADYTAVAIEDGWELEWGGPQVLAQYLPKGVSVTISSNRRGSIRLPELLSCSLGNLK